MPYTPPSQQSPVASRAETPSVSRSHSFSKPSLPRTDSLPSPAVRPNLPRSASSTSYLHKHRRSPSLSKSTSPAADDVVKEGSTGKGHGQPPANGNEDRSKPAPSSSLRRSPPPQTDSLIPIGALISPPDSSQNSSDEEHHSRRRKGRDLENLAELQAAIRIIEQHRESSPNRTNEETRKARIALGLVVPPRESAEGSLRPLLNAAKSPLSQEARRISHSRSSTESSPLLDRNGTAGKAPDSSDTDEAEEDDTRSKPPMVRKKSGELVRPALRPSFSRRRPSSMPGTPTYSKAVHFDSQLEHVRHFLQVDKPLAVSAGSSPVEMYEGEIEFPFGGEESSQPRPPPFEWEIRLPNFPRDTVERKAKPVRVEKVSLTPGNQNLVGVVAVANLAFHKFVVVRFTLDYWKTTSEVVAEFSNDVRRKQANDGCDRFNFTIKLADQANLENKTLFFCVRYNVNGQEYWDNNDSINFQVDFVKKAKPQTGNQGSGSRPSNALPRSRPQLSHSSGRPLSLPATFDDFAQGFDSDYNFRNFTQSPTKIMGESPIRFRNSKAATKNNNNHNNSIIPDAPTKRSNPAAQAFGNRYDFGASLSAAIQAASTSLGDRGGVSANDDSKAAPKRATFEPTNNSAKGAGAQSTASGNGQGTAKKPTSVSGTAKAGTGKDSSKAAELSSQKPSLQSASYSELLDKYCFFGSAKSSPPLTKAKLCQMDGGSDESSVPEYNLGVPTQSESPPAAAPLPHPPLLEESKASSRSASPHLSRSASPAMASGSASPASYAYPYLQSTSMNFFPETHTPTAIRG